MSRSMALALAVGVLCGATRPLAQDQSFPHTKQRGRATTEYKDNGLQVVASYDYSQRRHDSSWLLIDVAASAAHPKVLHRNNVTLVTPSGTHIMVADQRRFLEDSQNIRSLLQNAGIWRRQLDSYFFSSRSPHEPLQFFALPGEPVVMDSAILADDRVTLGGVFFEMPRGGWDAGTYSLVIDLEDARAALPITLD
jgi:hypothetical protein